MAKAIVTITENSSTSCHLSAHNVRDWNHIHRMLLQGLFPTLERGNVEVKAQHEKLALLRNFLYSLGAKEPKDAQNLLIMALFQLADETEGKRVVAPDSLQNVLTRT